MGTCTNKPLYQFDNFVTIQRQLPQASKAITVSNFEFQIHPYSPQYIRENIDSQYNQDTDGTEESFLVTEYTCMKVFELRNQLVTKRDKISDCLKNAIIGKICGSTVAQQTTFMKFVQPQGKKDYKKALFKIIIQTLIDIDLTCFTKGKRFGVYFDWPVFLEGIKEEKNEKKQMEEYVLEMIREIHQKNTLMDSSKRKKN